MAKCYFCGVEETEEHHIIPERYDPVKNETVKLCPECHGKVHELYSTLIRFLQPESRIPYETRKGGPSPSRMDELERALGERPQKAFEDALRENDGKMRPALEDVNGRLERSKHYDEETGGLISPNTFYKWTEAFGIRPV